MRLITQIGEQYVTPTAMPLFGLFDTADRDDAAITVALAKLDTALGRLNAMLPVGAYAVGDRLTTADVWLAPLRFLLEGLMSFSGRTNLLDQHLALKAYMHVARQDLHLDHIWREMDEGLKVFMASRTAS